jgi:hypothetical protein
VEGGKTECTNLGQKEECYSGAYLRTLLSFRKWALVSERENVEWYKQSVEKLVRQNRIETNYTQAQYVLDVVQVVQVLSH